MTVIVVARVTQALRGTLSRWMIEAQTGVFVGRLSRTVRDRLWEMILGLKRLGVCTMIERDTAGEQGFSLRTAGDSKRAPVDFDGLTLMKALGPSSEGSEDAGNPPVDGCGGDPPVRGPVDAATLDREGEHP
jgi:CRISPR-associated protein Cas2